MTERKVQPIDLSLRFYNNILWYLSQQLLPVALHVTISFRIRAPAAENTIWNPVAVNVCDLGRNSRKQTKADDHPRLGNILNLILYISELWNLAYGCICYVPTRSVAAESFPKLRRRRPMRA